MSQSAMPSMAAQKAKRIAEQNRKQKGTKGARSALVCLARASAIDAELEPPGRSNNSDGSKRCVPACQGINKLRVSSGCFQVEAAVAVAGDIEDAAISPSSGVDQEDPWLAVGRDRSCSAKKCSRSKYCC
jgi:hypothetical protein